MEKKDWRKDPRMIKLWQERGSLQDEMIWIGCNPSDPELFKKQAEEGFRLIGKMGDIFRKMKEVMDEYEV